jgi:hypothetical protein
MAGKSILVANDPKRKWSARRRIHLLRRKFDVDQYVRDRPFQISRMVNFIFRCPNTGLKVQHRWPDEEKPVDDKVYESVACPACTRMHFINRSTGKPLGFRD